MLWLFGNNTKRWREFFGNSDIFPSGNFFFCIILESPIADNIQQMFLDDLLTSYQLMENSLSKHLYQFYKAFEFSSLWNVDGTLADFQRRASEAAVGTGQLQGVLKLTRALQEIDSIQDKRRQCFTKFRHSTNIHKWSFDSVTHAAVCKCMHVCIFASIHASCMYICVRASVPACACANSFYPLQKGVFTCKNYYPSEFHTFMST